MSKSFETVIHRRTKRKPDEKMVLAADQTKNPEPEACEIDALMCPCFPHINIEDHVTGKSELNK